MILRRARPSGARVTLVPLIDVLFILLVYFMVTSVYLDLDMIPAATAPDAPRDQGRTGDAAAPADLEPRGTLLVRIDSSGALVVRGQARDPADLTALIRTEVVGRPDLEVLLLPSPRAPVQALATALDAVAGAEARRMRVLRLEAGE